MIFDVFKDVHPDLDGKNVLARSSEYHFDRHIRVLNELILLVSILLQ